MDGQATPAPEQQTPASEGVTTQNAQEQRYKHVVDGKEVEFTLDQLKNAAGQERSSQERFRKASELQKRYEPLAKAIENKDFDYLAKNLSEKEFRKFAESYLLDKIEYEELPEQEKEYRQKLKRLEELEARDKERELKDKESQEEARRSHFKAKAIAEIDDDIAKVLNGKKASPWLVAEIASEMIANLEAKDQARIPAEVAYKRAQHSFKNKVRQAMSDMTLDEAKDYLPEGFYDKVRKHFVNEVKSQYPVSNRKTEPQENNQKQKAKQTTDDFFNNL